MGGCSAPNCSNSTRRGKQLFRFPRDPFRNKKWVKNCRREFEPDSASRLCQDHFEQSQFEEIAKTAAGGKKLKPHAVPTLFRFRDRPYRAGSIPIAPYPPYATYAPIAPYILQPVKPEPVEKELNVGDHCYARRTPLPGMEEQTIFVVTGQVTFTGRPSVYGAGRGAGVGWLEHHMSCPPTEAHQLQIKTERLSMCVMEVTHGRLQSSPRGMYYQAS